MISKLGVPGLLGITMGLGLAVSSQSGTTAPVFNADTIRCYGPAANGTHAAATGNLARADAAQISASVAPAAQAALAAVNTCARSSCDAPRQRDLKRTLSDYLAARSKVTTDLFRQQGAKGLDAAASLFAQPGDLELSQALAGLHQSGALDIADFGDQREALALVVSKPAAAFRPCEAVYRTVHVKGYVY